jgi:uncharacterized RmlC-like cupin family protein
MRYHPARPIDEQEERMADTQTSTPTVQIIRTSEEERSKQGLQNIQGVSAERCGARGLWMGTIIVPPGARARAHLHEAHETAIYVMQGEGGMWYGKRLEQYVTCRAGDFIYIPAGVPHVPINTSQTQPMIGIAARTDPNEQESVVLLPELDANVS